MRAGRSPRRQRQRDLVGLAIRVIGEREDLDVDPWAYVAKYRFPRVVLAMSSTWGVTGSCGVVPSAAATQHGRDPCCATTRRSGHTDWK